jgi:hypothetical protein
MSSLRYQLKIPLDELKKPSVIVLIISNLVPVFGVLFLDWDIFQVMMLFWAENVVIGVFNIFKMLCSTAGNSAHGSKKSAIIPFFIAHYGIFTLVHGVLVFTIFGDIFENDDLLAGASVTYHSLMIPALGWAAAALTLSHAISFVTNYLGKGEYRNTTLDQLMVQPYTRVIILHITILIGGFLVMFFGAPLIGLILLIALKIYIDILSHVKQHNIFMPTSTQEEKL